MIKLTFACALVAASNAISLGTEGIEININGVDDNNNGDEVIEINIDMEDDDGAQEEDPSLEGFGIDLGPIGFGIDDNGSIGVSLDIFDLFSS